jgi:hypothetical protein
MSKPPTMTPSQSQSESVSVSESVSKSQSQSPPQSQPVFLKGDIREVRLNKRFDAVIALFHVISYQTVISALIPRQSPNDSRAPLPPVL